MTKKQSIPAGGFAGSRYGGLHASSTGGTYPWSVQPRIYNGDLYWCAFNALTGRRVGYGGTYDKADDIMRACIAEERAERRRRLDADARHGRTMENVRR